VIAETLLGRDRDHTELLERLLAGNERAVTLSAWGIVEVWDTAATCLRELAVGSAPGALTAGRATAIALHPDGRRVAVATTRPDSPLQIWDGASGKPIAVLDGPEGIVRAVAFSADGERLVSGGDDLVARLWPASAFA
jgi:WD40 repeat protein